MRDIHGEERGDTRREDIHRDTGGDIYGNT